MRSRPQSSCRRQSEQIAKRAALALTVFLALLGAVPIAQAQDDPGLVMELDLSRYELTLRDERSGAAGPQIPVVLGSPANPTPTGSFPVAWVILRPSWTPGVGARAAGAESETSSLSTPMGVAKIPFAAGGAIALHGGGDPRLIGQPISGGCVRTGDADLLRAIAWLDLQGALGEARPHDDGEVHRPLHRPTRMIVR
jgi:hypothetical protein